MAERHRTCAECSRQFSYQVARGADRIFCGHDCANAASARRRAFAMSAWPKCSVDGCGLTVRSSGSRLCEMHYMRNRRRGSVRKSVEENPPQPETRHSHGYVTENLPSHPLWGETSGRIYQHRRVFFDTHGKGPHACNWCGKVLQWAEMDVDHINAVRDDNDITNLVASCPGCNRDRARHKAANASRERAIRYAMNGETLTAREWADRIGISRRALLGRIRAGWPLERALTEKRGPTGPRPIRPMPTQGV